MENFTELELKLARFTPKTIPFDRLAAYIGLISDCFKNKKDFMPILNGIEEGSLCLRGNTIASENYINDHIAHNDNFRMKLNENLAKDNTQAVLKLVTSNGTRIYEYNGILPQKSENIIVTEKYECDALVRRAGAKNKQPNLLHSITIMLRDDTILDCDTSEENVLLASNYLYRELRFTGLADWERDGSTGTWSLKKFNIDKFEYIIDQPLSQNINELRQIFTNGWTNRDTLYDDLNLERAV